MVAIQKTKETLSHDDRTLHDEEIALGADAVLTKHLVFLLFVASTDIAVDSRDHDMLFGAGTITTELGITLESLESLYRASSESVSKSFSRLGNELVAALLKSLNMELDRRIAQRRVLDDDEMSESFREHSREEVRMEDNCTISLLEKTGREGSVPEYTPSPEGDLVLKKATHVLGHFARVGDATKPLAHFPACLTVLLKLVALHPYNRVPWEARLSALWMLANLGCNRDNMQMMACFPGLVDALIHVSCRELRPDDSVETTLDILRSRSTASRCLLNLSWAPENKIILGKQAALLDLLLELAVQRHAPLSKSRTVREILLTTRRHAIGALRNLAAGPRSSKLLLCGYNNGHLLSVLADAALNDPDQGAKDKAFAAINNLIIDDTAEQVVSCPGLVMALKDVLLSSRGNERDNKKSQNTMDEIKSGARTLTMLRVLERNIRQDAPAYPDLCELLDALNSSS